MPVISIAIQKGGSGKTTTALNLAAAFRETGQRVLLLDMDPQSHLSQALRLPDDPERSLYRILGDAAAGKAGPLLDYKYTVHGMDVIAGSLQLAFSEMELVSVYSREYLLDELLAPVKDQYDQVLIDCPPAVGMLTVNSLIASDYVLLPVQAEFLPLQGVFSFMQFFKKMQKLNKRLQLLGILITKYDPRVTMTAEVLERLRNEPGLEQTLFDAHIRINIAIAKAQQQGMDIFTFDRLSTGAINYRSLAYEVMERINNGGR